MSTPAAPATGGPIDRRSDRPHDRLDRLPLARRVAGLIGGYRGREGLVVGIEGAWGAGKIAFTGLVLKELETIGGSIVLPFNPWSLSEQNELTAEFVAALAGALGVGGDAPAPLRAQSYGARLRATAVRSLRFSGRAPEGLRVAFDRERRSAHEERYPIQEKLANLPGRLVVVMDDIDRIDEHQTRLVMKLVRIAASLPNVVFLLGYDRRRVAAALQEDDRPGEDMLKTLVQIAFTLPEPSRQELDHVLFERLRETVARACSDDRVLEDDERWRDLVYTVMPPLFDTIADVMGYAASLRLAFGTIAQEDIDVVDFVGVEAIRYFAPRLYATIAANRTLFTTAVEGRYFSPSDEAGERRARYEDVLRAAPEPLRAAMDRLCRCLFPMIAAETDRPEAREQWARERRVASRDSFPRYFELGIPEPRVSESEVLFLRRRFVRDDAVTALLREYVADGRLAPLLSQLLNRASIVPENDARALLLGIWALEGEIEHTGDAAALAMQLGRGLLRDAIQPEKRAAFLEELIAATRASHLPRALRHALEQNPL